MLKEISNSSLQNLESVMEKDEKNDIIMKAQDHSQIVRFTMKHRLAANILFCGVFAAVSLVPASYFRNPIGALLIAFMLYLVPGAPWVGTMGFKRRSILQMVSISLMASAGLIVLCFIVRFELGLQVSRTSLFLLLGCTGGMGFLVTRSAEMWKATFLENLRCFRVVVLWLVAALFIWIVLFYAATRYVPPFVDHDLEIQGTAYSLVHTLKPMMITDRHTIFYFAHPPIHHTLVAATFLAYDSLENVAYYFTHIPKLLPLLKKGTVPSSPEVDAAIGEEYNKFNEQPNLFETRLDNIFYSVLTILFLAGWAMRSPTGRFVGCLCVAAYATAPEILVRMTYGGYMPTTNLWLVAIAILYLSRSSNRVLMGACFILALVNHKAVILPFCLAVADLFQLFKPKAIEYGRDFRGIRSLIAFGCGTILFWVYGLGVDSSSFFTDHVSYHILDRIIHNNPFDWGGYPAIGRLWVEFVIGVGPGLVLVGGLALFAQVKSFESLRNPLISLTLWFAVGAVAFSIVDWRMTKHLMLIAPALVIAGSCYEFRHRSRIVVTGVLAISLLYNISMMVLMSQNFSTWIPSPAW